MRPLVWSRMQSGLLNGKVKGITMVTVGLHTSIGCYVVSPKLPGLRAVQVDSEQEGIRSAEEMYQKFLGILS